MDNFTFLQNYQELQKDVMYNEIIDLGFAKVGFCEIEKSFLIIINKKDRLEFAYECNKLADGLWFLGSHCLGPNCQRRGKGEKTLVLGRVEGNILKLPPNLRCRATKSWSNRS